MCESGENRPVYPVTARPPDPAGVETATGVGQRHDRAVHPAAHPATGCRPAADLLYPMLCLRATAAKGVGVFALRRFRTAETLERAPVMVLPEPQWESLNQTALEHYYYSWRAGEDAIVFGFGSFYNHSDNPNAVFVRRHAEQIMEYVALRDIEPEEEITIKYGCPLWFDPV